MQQGPGRGHLLLLNVGVTTITERVPTATPGDDRGEEAKLFFLFDVFYRVCAYKEGKGLMQTGVIRRLLLTRVCAATRNCRLPGGVRLAFRPIGPRARLVRDARLS